MCAYAGMCGGCARISKKFEFGAKTKSCGIECGDDGNRLGIRIVMRIMRNLRSPARGVEIIIMYIKMQYKHDLGLCNCVKQENAH